MSELSPDFATDIDEEAIRMRAWEISQSPDAGSADENWARAQAELRGEGDQSERGPREVA
jgi:hypothetical protein